MKRIKAEKNEFKKYEKDIPEININNAIQFMQTEIDYIVEKNQPVIRLFGTMSQGSSILAFVNNFEPYFYVEIPQGLELAQEELISMTELFSKQGSKLEFLVKKIEIVEKMDIMYYSEKKRRMLKIYTFLPRQVPEVRSIFEEGFKYKNYYFSNQTYESNILFNLRFMIDMEIVGMSWIEIPPNSYHIIEQKQKSSNCSIEIRVDNPQFIIPKKPTIPEFSIIAPIRILSFDIECVNDQNKFPTPEENPIITIANVVQIHGDENIFCNVIFTLKSCHEIAGSDIRSFEDEKEMLIQWQNFIIAIDPDIITGYNINNFDLGYIINRGKTLKIDGFPAISKIKYQAATYTIKTLASKQMGSKEFKDISMDGRIIFDIYQYIQREFKLSSYTLNSVSVHFLGEEKDDLHYTLIKDLFKKDEITRSRIAHYCLKDALLPLMLMNKLLVIYNYTEMSRVTGVPFHFLLTRGQQIKVASQIYRQTRLNDFVVPTDKTKDVYGGDDKFKGADVLQPKKGYYRMPIATLDFASLYPSIMIAHNLCYTTLLKKEDALKMDPSKYTTTPNGDYFVKKEMKQGILPRILEDLILARKKTREILAKETDPFKKAVLDGRQLAMKISANSVYGFTGAQSGQLCCIPVSASVTSFGRDMIRLTQSLVTEKYCIQNGYKANSEVIYGDTDSVMVNFGVPDITEAMNLGKEAASFISSKFIKPIKLEFEKVYYPYLLMNKKRYAGVLWTKPDKFDKMDAKGIETVRRDNCGLVREVVGTCLKKLLIENNPTSSLEFAKGLISDLYQNKVDLSLLIITKGLGKKVGEENEESGKSYQTKTAHAELAEKMRKRDETTAPGLGDRVSYVMVSAGNKLKAYEKAEDPLFALENGLALDIDYYIEHMLKKPLKRIFKRVINNVEKELFSGEHVSNKFQAKLAGSSGLGKYFSTKTTCINCKVLINKGALCQNCKAKEREIFIEREIEFRNFECKMAEIWSQCQRCQGNMFQEIICTNRDCPLFYMRVKTVKDYNECKEIIKRLEY